MGLHSFAVAATQSTFFSFFSVASYFPGQTHVVI